MRLTRGPYDACSVEHNNRVVSGLGARAASFTLAWLATHRGRLRGLLLGGHKLSVLVVWDTGGQTSVRHTDAEVDALATILNGHPPPPRVDARAAVPGDGICGRLLVGRGSDVSDPLCVRLPGHHGPCAQQGEPDA